MSVLSTCNRQTLKLWLNSLISGSAKGSKSSTRATRALLTTPRAAARYQSWAMWHGVIAAVNLYLSSQSQIYVGMEQSMWTKLSGIMVLPGSSAAPLGKLNVQRGFNGSFSVRCRGSRQRIIVQHYDQSLPVDRIAGEITASSQLPSKCV